VTCWITKGWRKTMWIKFPAISRSTCLDIGYQIKQSPYFDLKVLIMRPAPGVWNITRAGGILPRLDGARGKKQVWHPHQWKHGFLTRHLQILGSLVLAVSLSVYYLLLSISITNFMSNRKRALIIELLWTRSHRSGGFGALIPPNKAPSPPNWNMKYYKSVEFLSIFRIWRPAAQT